MTIFRQLPEEERAEFRRHVHQGLDAVQPVMKPNDVYIYLGGARAAASYKRWHGAAALFLQALRARKFRQTSRNLLRIDARGLSPHNARITLGGKQVHGITSITTDLRLDHATQAVVTVYPDSMLMDAAVLQWQVDPNPFKRPFTIRWGRYMTWEVRSVPSKESEAPVLQVFDQLADLLVLYKLSDIEIRDLLVEKEHADR